MPTVAHCTALYLHTTGSWIYPQIRRLRRYQPVVFAQETANLDEFPVASLHSARAQAPWKRLAGRAFCRITGQYAFYAAAMARAGVDLIHAHFGYQGARLLRCRRLSGRPLLTSFYGADATRFARLPGWQRRYARLFAAGEGFLVEGSAMRRQLIGIGCPADRIRVHHLGIDLEAVRFAARRPAAALRLLICAGFKEKKGIPYALRGLARALDRRPFPFELTLVGDGPDRPRIESLVHELGLADRTRLPGMLPYHEVLAELQRCDVLLQTSVTAADGDTEGGAPVILLDAQASGVPVIASRHGDIAEYVLEGESGLLAPERDVEAIAACIRQLAEQPGRWAAMGAAGRRHVERHYNAEVQVAGLEAIYDQYLV